MTTPGVPPQDAFIDTDDALVGIGRAATILGVSERALRYYQQIGLLTPSGRTPGGMRRYAPVDLDRVRRIRELQDLLGFNLEEIRGILGDEDRLAKLRAEYNDEHTSLRRRRDIIQEAVHLREGLRSVVEAKLSRLQAFLADLDSSIDRSRRKLDEAAAPEATAR
ncbi:MerR family transcriptional regulator [Acidiferrimicrobium sp. IK]|uniref:MerR family transcriptional regulator n=1 Tax=Acidiferrimicrobium sp. IK TaxID=2871700 RepID=UPI0021CB20FC|nr:MerR family transcriptional regulator [Acidiferrimicrobium sp. IK]MCU4184711.1 MerR family transcriptional regulator [Acidiferrimicrobium sp. IK]